MKGRRKGENLLSPALLHKCVEERENTPELSLHEPAMVKFIDEARGIALASS